MQPYLWLFNQFSWDSGLIMSLSFLDISPVNYYLFSLKRRKIIYKYVGKRKIEFEIQEGCDTNSCFVLFRHWLKINFFIGSVFSNRSKFREPFNLPVSFLNRCVECQSKERLSGIFIEVLQNLHESWLPMRHFYKHLGVIWKITMWQTQMQNYKWLIHMLK